jgi:hypothetical protein
VTFENSRASTSILFIQFQFNKRELTISKLQRANGGCLGA